MKSMEKHELQHHYKSNIKYRALVGLSSNYYPTNLIKNKKHGYLEKYLSSITQLARHKNLRFGDENI